jgi:hypothetical protein
MLSEQPVVRPPQGLELFEALVMVDEHPAVCIIDRDLMRSLLRYVRWLEAQTEGSFW